MTGTSIWRTVCSVLWLWLGASIAWAESVPGIVLKGEAGGINVVPHMAYLDDPHMTIDMHAAFSRFAAGEGRPIGATAVNFGFVDGRVWFYFRLLNAASTQRPVFIEIDYPILDSIDVFCRVPGERPQFFRLGDHVQHEAHPVRVRNFVVPLTLAPSLEQECVFRIQSTSNIALPVKLSDAVPFIEQSRRNDWWLGLSYGIAFALMVYNLVVFFASGERVYLLYLVHLAASGAYNALLDGVSARLWSTFDLQDHGLLFFICLSQASALLFAREYLGYTGWRGWPGILSAVCLAMQTVQMAALFLFPLTTLVHSVLYGTVVTSLLVLSLGLARWRAAPLTVSPFVLGFGAVVCMAVGAVLVSLGITASVEVTTYGMKAAWAFELAMLSTGLALRIRALERQRIETERQAADTLAAMMLTERRQRQWAERLNQRAEGVYALASGIQADASNGWHARQAGAILCSAQVMSMQLREWVGVAGGDVSEDTVLDSLTVLSECAATVAPKCRLMDRRWVMQAPPGFPRQIVVPPLPFESVLMDFFAQVVPWLEASSVCLQLSLTDDPQEGRLVLSLVIEADTMIVGRETLWVQSSPSAVRLGVRSGWSPSEGRAVAWMTIPVHVPDDVECLEFAWSLDLTAGPPASSVDVRPVVPADRPLTSQPAAAVRVPVVRAQGERAPGELCVLLAEDNPINQKVISGFLARMAITPVIVEDGAAAVDAVCAADPPFDLILLDCQMPRMNGFDVTRAIRQWESSQGRPESPVIGLSAHAGDTFRQQALDAGMTRYLTKPLTFRQVSDTLVEVMSLGRAG